MKLASSSVDEPFIEAVMTSTPERILSVDEDGTVVFATPSVERLLGYAPKDLIDRPFERFVVDQESEGSVLDAIDHRLESKPGPPPSDCEHLEFRLRHEDGHDVPVSSSVSETRYQDRRFYTLTLRDVSDQSDPLPGEEIDTTFQKVFEYATEPLLLVDPGSDSIDACNGEACDLLEYSREELLETAPSELHPDELTAYREFTARATEEGDGWTEELHCHTATGERFPAEVSAVLLEFAHRDRLLVRIEDLTGRRRRERDHRETQALFEKTFEHVNDAILVFDPDADEFRDVNPRACELLGYDREELLEMGPSEIHPHEIDRFHEIVDDVLAEGSGWIDEFSCYTCDGDRLPAEVSMATVDLEGTPHVLASVRDVSERKEREARLREEHDRLSALFENSNDPIVEITYEDEAPVIRGVNPTFETVFGYDSEEVLGRTIEDVLVPDDETRRSIHRELVERVLDGERIEEEVERETVAGPRDFLLRAVPFDVENGSLGTYAIYTDITERKTHARRLEGLNVANRRLLQAETERAVGDTTVDIAHEVLDQPLVAMWSYEPGEDELVPLAATEPATDLDPTDDPDVGSIPAGTAEMRIFHDGETTFVDDYSELDGAAHPETPLGTLLLYPLGEHGLLNVGFRTLTDVDPADRSLLDILAQNVQVTLERFERERAVRRRSAAMAEATDGMGITDENGEFSYVNDALAATFGYDDPDALVGATWSRLYDSEESERLEREALPTVEKEGSWRDEAVGQRADGTTIPVDLSLAALEDGGIICVVRDVSDRKALERKLEGLNEASRELMKADSREEIAEIGVDTCERIVGYDLACIRTYDHETNRLEIVALTDDARELLSSQPAYDMETTLAGKAFRTDEIVKNTVEDAGSMSPFEYASFHVPIGSYGVLSVVDPTATDFDDQHVGLTEMLAVTVRTAIARAEHSRLLRNQQQELRSQRDQLETLARINTLIQEISDGLVSATTRAELERTICAHLAESDLYGSAWIGDVEEAADRVVAREGFGIDEGYLEAVEELSLSQIANGTVKQAIETKEVTVIRQYHLSGNEQLTDEQEPDVEAIAAVPFGYGDRVHGVLVVNGTHPEVFGENQIAGFESLGKLAGFAVNAIRNRELLLSDSIVELELSVTDPETFYIQATEELDCQLRFERSVPLEGDRMANYHTVSGADPASVLEVAEASAEIEEARAISERDDGLVLQTVTTTSPIQVALEAGATLRSGVVEDGEAHITLEAPQSADVRRIVRAFDDEFADVDMIAKREHERSVQTADEFRQSVDDRLTEKQQAAVEAAYAAGYYDWPRETTAEELAESMGISSSTLHQHLRKGIWSLLDAFFEDVRLDDRP
ncbi:PAS domain S-box protein [Natrialbaceae archaeon A-gly3]